MALSAPRPRDPDTTLSQNLLVFGRLLRSAGFAISPGREIELHQALTLIDLGNRARVKEACRAILVTRREQVPVFERAFDLFFSNLFVPDEAQELPPDVRPAPRADASETPPEPMDGDESESEPGTAKRAAPASEQSDEQPSDEASPSQTFSATEVLRETDFDRFSAEELASAREMMRQLRLRPTTRRTRRMIRSANGKYLDMRAIVRGMRRTAGEPASLAWRERKLKRRKLVLLCDISGSMETYSRVLLQFLHAVRQGLNDVEVFVFGTRLTRVTRDLAHRNVDAALERISRRVHDFAGGTRIGRSFHEFNRRWARRVLGQGAVAIVISDGWDRGDPLLLRSEMERLQRGTFRLIWLNPLLGLADYQPITIGMRTALEFVDDFMPAHNLASLERLARRLSSLEGRRPIRRQAFRPADGTAVLPRWEANR